MARKLFDKCDAEIGSIKRGWHVCGKRATKQYRVTTHGLGSVYRLSYCKRHDIEKRLSCRYEIRFLDNLNEGIMPFVPCVVTGQK